jgi:hypothetical protein
MSLLKTCPALKKVCFVAMSTDTTFQLHRWKDIAEKTGLKLRKE